MTQVRTDTTASPPGGGQSRAFLPAGVLAIVLVAVAVPLDLVGRLPAVGALMERGGAVGGIALIAITLSLWVVLFTGARMLIAARERAAIATARHALTQPGRASTAEALLTSMRNLGTANTLLARRLGAIAAHGRTAREVMASTLAGHSELDHARGDVSYLPARALTWALPALGFLGTAAEMSRAIGGLGESVGATASYSDLRNALVSNVIPPLADAFGVTLFALGAAVVCHLLLTWANTRDQRVLLDVEEVTMQVFAEVPGTAPSAGGLNGEITELTRELGMARSTMKESADQVASLDLDGLSHLQPVGELVPLLKSVNDRLDEIRAELAKPLMLSRTGDPGYRG